MEKGYIYIYEVQISKDAFLGRKNAPAARYLGHKKLAILKSAFFAERKAPAARYSGAKSLEFA